MTKYSDVLFQLELSGEQMSHGKPIESMDSLSVASRVFHHLEGSKFRSAAVEIWNAANNIMDAVAHNSSVARRGALLKLEIEEISVARGEPLVFAQG